MKILNLTKNTCTQLIINNALMIYYRNVVFYTQLLFICVQLLLGIENVKKSINKAYGFLKLKQFIFTIERKSKYH